MRIGLQIPNFTWPGGPAEIAGTLAEIASAAEEARFHSLWVMDHFFQIGDREHSRGLGIQQVIFNMPNVHEILPLAAFGREIIPAEADF
jgi:alkanesulfonate monooxygenase SsuD/methylene tetrahydromethanopterin reductase-like flavin-dependent oxidoreductase (luciferase family)